MLKSPPARPRETPPPHHLGGVHKRDAHYSSRTSLGLACGKARLGARTTLFLNILLKREHRLRLGRDGERNGISQLAIDFHESAVFQPIREGHCDESEGQHKGGQGNDRHARKGSSQ